MKSNRAVLAVALGVVLLGAGWWLFARSERAEPIDLIETLGSAVKAPAGGTFETVDAELNGETRRAIYAPPPTRITWKVRVPYDAWLKVAMGLKSEAWTQEGNGVLFLVGVSDGKRFDPLFTQHVNPFGNTGDRKWIPVRVDLSAYAGEEVELIFNTRSGPPEQGDDPRNDHALWGAPEIIVR
jgi:hypothetical protein